MEQPAKETIGQTTDKSPAAYGYAASIYVQELLISAGRESAKHTLEQSAGKSLEHAETIEAKQTSRIASQEFNIEHVSITASFAQKSEMKKVSSIGESIAMKSYHKEDGEPSHARNDSIT